MVRGFCCLLHRRVPLHRGLLLPGGPPEGDEHRGALVPADGHLLRVSFCDFWGAIAANRRVQAAIGQEKEPTVLVFSPLKAS